MHDPHELDEFVVKHVIDRTRGNESVFDTFERLALYEAMRCAGGNQSAAAEYLGVSQRVINYRLQKYSWRHKDLEGVAPRRGVSPAQMPLFP